MNMPPPPHVAFFMHNLAGGGVERMRLRLIAELLRRGHPVTLIVQTLTGPLRNNIPPGTQVISLETKHIFASIVPLGRVLASLQPDFLISSLDHNNIAALCARPLGARSTRLIICQHNALSAEAALGWKYRAVPLLYHLLSWRADAIIAVSHGVADDLAASAKLNRSRISVVMNPVIKAGFENHPTPAPPHPWLMDRTLKVFLFAGRLVEQKDPLLLVQAFAQRHGIAPAARLIVLGEGPLQPALQRLVLELGLAEAVYLAGFVSDPAAWIAAATALVLPSRYEGFGNVIVEALACGTPVIATDCPHGPAEILAQGQFGRLVPVGNATALAAAMTDDIRDQFPAARCRARAAAFTLESCADAHEMLFHRIADRPLRQRRIFGFLPSSLDARHVADMIVTAPTHLSLVVTPNLDHLRHLRRPGFAAAYKDAALICIDGLPISLYAAARCRKRPQRTTGCDILHAIMAHDDLPTIRGVAVVESEPTCRATLAWLQRKNIAQNWLLITAPTQLKTSPDRQRDLAATIAAFAPGLLLMTLGAPLSEEFVQAHADILPPCWAPCIGQALRIELGLTPRAPRVMRAMGMEWAWRIWQEPRRLLPRYAAAALWFPVAVLRDMRA